MTGEEDRIAGAEDGTTGEEAVATPAAAATAAGPEAPAAAARAARSERGGDGR